MCVSGEQVGTRVQKLQDKNATAQDLDNQNQEIQIQIRNTRKKVRRSEEKKLKAGQSLQNSEKNDVVAQKNLLLCQQSQARQRERVSADHEVVTPQRPVKTDTVTGRNGQYIAQAPEAEDHH